MKRLFLHVGLPMILGLLVGLALRWTWLQCLTLPLSLVLFTHWASRYFEGDAYPALDSPRIGLGLAAALIILSWLAFWVWTRPSSSGYSGFLPEPPLEPVPVMGWGHPRIVSYLIVLAPATFYILSLARHVVATVTERPRGTN